MAMNVYTKKPRSVAEYTRMRGVTDFSNAAQFNIFESGFSQLIVISKPAFLEHAKDESLTNLLNTFCNILENEFKGLSGIEDKSLDSIEVTDGVSTLNLIGKNNKQSAAEVSMQFTEKSGSTITKFISTYMDYVRDGRSQAKTYGGLIEQGLMAPGFENEVFNFLYIVMDNTMLAVEKAYLLVNAWPTKASFSDLYNSTKGEIDKKEIDVSFQCFVIDGEEVDRRALRLLAKLNTPKAVANAATVNGSTAEAVSEAGKVNTYVSELDRLHRDSNTFKYDAYEVVDKSSAGTGALSGVSAADNV